MRASLFPSRRQHPAAAFTLIELLVVIAVIAVLAAILFPVFAAARARARQATCLSNVHQLAIGVLMYVQDYDEAFPLETSRVPYDPKALCLQGPGQPCAAPWQYEAEGYIKNYAVSVCPDNFLTNSDPEQKPDAYLSYGMPPASGVHKLANWGDMYYTGQEVAWQGIGGSFNDNTWSDPSTTNTPSADLASVNAASAMTLLTDASAWDWWATGFPAGSKFSTSGGTGGTVDNDFFHYVVQWYPDYDSGPGPVPGFGGCQRFGPIPRHLQQTRTVCNLVKTSGGQLVVAFTDGHAKSFPITQYFSTMASSSGQTVYKYLWPGD